jgi:multimeric flavodoxin WrbA
LDEGNSLKMKKMLILNGAPDEKFAMDARLAQLETALTGKAILVETITIRDLQLHHCTGCWSCWVKTPGVCIHTDDAVKVLRQVVEADVLLMASPLMMGYPSALLKRFMDRMIPLVHPYIEWEGGECHHLARYAHYPKMALYLEKEADTDEEDIRLTSDLFARAARNLKTSLVFTHILEDDLNEVCDEINCL